jgi:hypothetical protein
MLGDLTLDNHIFAYKVCSWTIEVLEGQLEFLKENPEEIETMVAVEMDLEEQLLFLEHLTNKIFKMSDLT